jgi:hypothetical protein
VQESDFQGGHGRTSSVSSIRKRAKRANIPSQTAEMLRAARPDPSLAQKRRSLGMTNLLRASFLIGFWTE